MSHSYLSAPLPCPSTTQNQQVDRNLFKMLTCAGAATAQQVRIPAQVWVQGGKCSVLWPWSLAEDECGGKKANSLGTSKGRCVCCIVSLLSPPSPWAHLPIKALSRHFSQGPEPCSLTCLGPGFPRVGKVAQGTCIILL